jgi:hypothetical protein
VCDFPLAHGYGIVTDTALSKISAATPALVLPTERNNAVLERLGQ